MSRLLGVAAFFMILFMWGFNIEIMADAPLLMKIGLHGCFGSIAVVAIAWIIRGEP